MKDIIERIQILSKANSKWLDIYPGAPIDKIEEVERLLKYKINKDLKELYLFSNGISFIDYCFFGINNKKLLSILDINYTSISENNEFLFMKPSGGEIYGLSTDNNKNYVFVQKGMFTTQFIAHNIKEFFEIFLDKMEILLTYATDDEFPIYFDDPSVPESLSMWPDLSV